ncbi:ATP-dependent helicase [bacterium]|nr:ATP-dependent helicase [bacterium]
MTPSRETRIGPTGWDAVVAAADGPQLVVAGPGAGKTEFLVRRALHLIDDREVPPEQILLLSFSRRGAADLKARIAAGLARSFTVVAASTFHSFAYRLLEAHAGRFLGWPDMPTLLTGPEQVALVESLLREEDPVDWPLLYRGLLDTRSFADEVADFMLRCGEHLMDPDALAERATDRADWRALPAFLAKYRSRLESMSRIDYGSLQAAAVRMLGDPGVADITADQFRYVLVDEYQDTTLAQARMLERLIAAHRNLTAAGDPYQSIYSFRGADLQNIAEFPARFCDDAGVPAQRIVLTTSFRVPRRILDAAVRVTAGGSLPGGAGPVIPAPGEGSVETYGFNQQSHEAEWIAGEVQRMHLSDAIPYRDMAVLVRSKRRFLPELSRALGRRNIPHDEPDRRLVDHPAVRMVLECVRAATGDEPERSAAVRRVLLGPLTDLSLGGVREIERVKARTGRAWPEMLHDAIPGPLTELVCDPTWASATPAAEGFWHVWSTLPQITSIAADPSRTDHRRAWSSFSQVLDRLAERNPDATLAEYLEWSEAEDFEATPLLEYRAQGEDRLTLTTLHQAKGMEFQVVFLADAIEGVFPDLRARESLLGVRHLSRTQPTGSAEYARFRLQEEMRLAYTAMVRASRRVVWTATARGAEDGTGLPSRFLPMVAGVGTMSEAVVRPDERSDPVTPLEVEAHLRRTVRDPEQAAAHRLAALAVLASDDPRRGRPSRRFAGVLERGPDDGVVPRPLHLSPSRAESYLTCPRRYVFEGHLGIGSDFSIYADFGTLVHDALEAAEKTAVARGLAHASLDIAIASLDEVWDPAPFGGGVWAESWHRRAVDIITHLYENWPGSGPPAALEHWVDTELHGVRWRGRIDRIEQVEGPEGPGLTVIDYKTTRTPVTKANAAVSLQLGFYTLAVAADLELSGIGPVVGAEFWYPASQTKSVSTRQLDLDRLPDVEALLESAAAGIAAENWPAVVNQHCDRCQVRRVCPEWPEGREAFSS